MNSRCFEIHHSSSMSFNLSNIGEFFLELVSKGMYLNSK